MPNGCNDDELPWNVSAPSVLDTKMPYMCSAELNAILNKNSASVKGCTMYVPLSFPLALLLALHTVVDPKQQISLQLFSSYTCSTIPLDIVPHVHASLGM